MVVFIKGVAQILETSKDSPHVAALQAYIGKVKGVKDVVREIKQCQLAKNYDREYMRIEIKCTENSDSHALFFHHLLPVILDRKGSLQLKGTTTKGRSGAEASGVDRGQSRELRLGCRRQSLAASSKLVHLRESLLT